MSAGKQNFPQFFHNFLFANFTCLHKYKTHSLHIVFFSCCQQAPRVNKESKSDHTIISEHSYITSNIYCEDADEGESDPDFKINENTPLRQWFTVFHRHRHLHIIALAWPRLQRGLSIILIAKRLRLVSMSYLLCLSIAFAC